MQEQLQLASGEGCQEVRKEDTRRVWTFGFPGTSSHDAPCAAASCVWGTPVPHMPWHMARYPRWDRGGWAGPGALLGILGPFWGCSRVTPAVHLQLWAAHVVSVCTLHFFGGVEVDPWISTSTENT